MEKTTSFYKEQLKNIGLLVLICMALIYLAGHEEVDCDSKTQFFGNFATCSNDEEFHVLSRAGMDIVLPGAMNGKLQFKNKGEVLVVSNDDGGECGTFFIVDDEVVFQSENIEHPMKVAGVRIIDADEGKKQLVVEYMDYVYGALTLMRVNSSDMVPHVVLQIPGAPSIDPNTDIECD